MNKNLIINYIINICHGKTEEIFIKDVVFQYLGYKFGEISEPSKVFDDFYPVKPISLSNENDSIQFNTIVKNSMPLFSKEFINLNFESLNSFGNQKIFFILVLDKNEPHSKPIIEEEVIKNNAKEEIIEVLKNIYKKRGLNLEKVYIGSKVIYFEKAIEDCLPDYTKEKKKLTAMIKWINKNKGKWESSDDIRKTFSNIKKEKSNIIELFDVLDKIINDYISN